MTADHITGKLENIISGHQINADDAAWLRGLISHTLPTHKGPP